MNALLGKVKHHTIRGLARLLYRAGILNLVSLIVDCVQKRKKEEGQMLFPFVQRRRAKSLRILMYHGVSDANSPYLPTTPIQVFQNHMQYLSDHHQVLDLLEGVERLKKQDLPDRAVVVTLDDGYRDNYLHAFPILKRLGLTATVFLATGVIGNSRVLWHDEVCHMISRSHIRTLRGFGSEDSYVLSSDEGKRSAQDGILWYLRSLDNEVRIKTIDQLRVQLEIDQDTKDPELMLNWDEVQEMYDYGVRFGAHTVTHPILSKLSLDDVAQEVRESKRTIEDVLNHPVLTFAYPSGREQDYNRHIKEIIEQAGFTCAVSTISGTNYGQDDVFEMKRIGFWDRDIETFGLRFEQFRFGD